MGQPPRLARSTPSPRPATSGANRPTRTRPAKEYAPTRENDCTSESGIDRIDPPANPTSGGSCGARADSSGPLDAKKTRPAAKPAPLAEPPTSTTGAGPWHRVTGNRSPDSDDNRNEGSAPGPDRPPLALHGPPCAGNDRDARHPPDHSADIGVAATSPGEAPENKKVDPTS